LFIGGENMQNNDWMNMIENMNRIRLFSRSLIPRATKEHEISSQHLDLLCHLIINNDGMTPLKLSKVMGVSKTIISRLIDGLSKSGYVIKKQDDNDKRSYDVFITELGEKKVDEILKFYLGPIYDLRRKLGEKNFLQLMDCIKMANEKISEGENGK